MIRLIFVLILTLGAALAPLTFAASSVAGSNGAIIKPPHDNREYRHLTLDNGLEVVVVSVPGAQFAAASLTIDVGSMADPEEAQGLAHYLEHMLIQGSEKYPERNKLSEFVAKHSGHANALTFANKTQYLFSVDTDYFEKSLDIFSSHFSHPSLSTEFSEKELTAIDEEWQRKKGMPSFVRQMAFQELLAIDHPMRGDFGGNRASLLHITAEALNQKLVDFFEMHYSPERMKLVLASEVSVDRLEDYAKTFFSGIPPRPPKAIVRKSETAKLDFAGKILKVEIEKSANLLQLVFPINASKNEWRYKTLAYVYQLVTSKEKGSLIDSLQSDNLVHKYQVTYNPVSLLELGHFSIEFELTSKGVDAQDVIIARTLDYLREIRESGVSEDRAQVLSETLARDMRSFRGYTVTDSVQALGGNLIYLPLENIVNADFVFEYDEKEIRETLSQLTPENLSVITIVQDLDNGKPLKHAEGAFLVEDLAQERIENWSTFASSAKLPPVSKIKKDEEEVLQAQYLEKTKRLVNKRGVYAWLAHSCCSRLTLGELTIEFNSQLSYKDVRHFVGAHVINNIYRKRTQAYVERISQANEMYVTTNNNLTANTVLTVIGSSKHLEEISMLLVEDFVNLEFTENEVQTEISPYVLSMESATKDSVLGIGFSALMHHFGVAPFQWTTDQRAAALKTLDVAFVRDLHARIVKKGALKIYAFGNFSEQQVIDFSDKIKRTVGNADSAKLFTPKFETKPKRGKLVTITEEADSNGVVLMIAYRSGDKSELTLDKFEVINRLYKTSFFNELRTRKQMAYALDSYVRTLAGYPAFGLQIESNNNSLESLRQEVMAFNAGFVEELHMLSEDEYEQVKMQVLKGITSIPQLWHESHDLKQQIFDPKVTTVQQRVYALMDTSKDDLIAFYIKNLVEDNTEKVVVQVRGSSPGNESLVK